MIQHEAKNIVRNRICELAQHIKALPETDPQGEGTLFRTMYPFAYQIRNVVRSGDFDVDAPDISLLDDVGNYFYIRHREEARFEKIDDRGCLQDYEMRVPLYLVAWFVDSRYNYDQYLIEYWLTNRLMNFPELDLQEVEFDAYKIVNLERQLQTLGGEPHYPDLDGRKALRYALDLSIKRIPVDEGPNCELAYNYCRTDEPCC